MDFVTGLPCSFRKYDSTLVIIDRLTKSTHFLSFKTTDTTEDYVKLYIKEIVRLHGTPISIISDKVTQFTTNFQRSFQKGLGTQTNLIIAFQPRIDGQAEHTRGYVEKCALDFKGNQDVHLSHIEFAYNNNIRIAPFEVLYRRRCRSLIGWFDVGEAGLLG